MIDAEFVRYLALVEVDLQYGSDGDVDRDDGDTSTDSLPFDFVVEVDEQLKITRVQKLEFDTSGFYDE